MLSIAVSLLTGRYRATDFDDRSRAEWPPHPARLYFAAVNAAFSEDEVDPDEAEALRWWETAGAPEISFSDIDSATGSENWTSRAPVQHFVPGNYATSWTRDTQLQWGQVIDAEFALSVAQSEGSEKTTASARKALVKLRSKVRTDTTKFTQPKGSESEAIVANVLELLPENRNRQIRMYPAVRPMSDTITFTWPSAEPTEVQRAALDGILARIGRLGHSASFVSCTITASPPTPTWIPALPNTRQSVRGAQLRTVTDGVLDQLSADYSRHQGNSARVLPAELTRYVEAKPTAVEARTQDGIGEWIILQLPKGQTLGLARTQDITRAVRGALMAHSTQPVAPVISGHRAGTGRTAALDSSHLTILTLPNVGNLQSDGRIHAVALCLPEPCSDEDRKAVHTALSHWAADRGELDCYSLTLPGGSNWELRDATVDASSTNTRRRKVVSRSYWTRAATQWSSVTPVALDRHPKVNGNADLDEFNAAVQPIVARMCERVGLPTPTGISAGPAAIWGAVPPVGLRRGGPRTQNNFPRFRVGGNGDGRFTTHLQLRFPEPVSGPLILGAGRYFGYGLMLPTPGSAIEEASR